MSQIHESVGGQMLHPQVMIASFSSSSKDYSGRVAD